jgi:integrase
MPGKRAAGTAIARSDQIVLARSGSKINTSGVIWVLSAEDSIDWSLMPMLPNHILLAVQGFIEHLIRTGSPRYSESQFNFLKTTLCCLEDYLSRFSPDGTIDAAAFSHASDKLSTKVAKNSLPSYLSAYRRWYIWCADTGFDGFDEDVATDLEERILPRAIRGGAVLSHDPNRGPLNHVEFNALLSKLRSRSRFLLLSDLCAAWLSIAFGANSKSLRLLCEDDLDKTLLDDGTAVYELRIPRIKKRTPGERDQHRTRPLDSHIGRLLDDLIVANEKVRSLDLAWDDRLFKKPLFAQKNNPGHLAGTAFEREAYRLGKRDFAEMLANVVHALGLLAFPSGKPLKLTPRRLRYTFATRLVQGGASPLEVADALDHSDTTYVMVYFNARSDAVARLDEKLALRLAPYAQAFLGQIIGSESEATRTDDLASRIKIFDRDASRLETLGSCGNFGFCGLFAPVACYTCALFQPWLDGPHEAVLADLLRQRDQNIERGADPKFTQMHDLTIYAVGEVVRRCGVIRTDPDAAGLPA